MSDNANAALELPDDEPVFYAPSLDYYVVTRYADVEQVFLDPKTYAAATAQLAGDVAEHHGRFELANAPPRGARATLIFPRSAAPA